MLLALQGAVSQGILWGIMTLGVYITYKLLDIADLSVDGSLALGGCVCAVAITNGVDPALALLLALVAGALAGAVTGILHAALGIPAILSGILTMISLWSINLHIMGKANIPLLNTPTIFSTVARSVPLTQSIVTMIMGAILVTIIIFALYWFFGTEIGAAMRATGNNEYMIRALGANTKLMKLLALMLSNALVGLAGGLICESQKYADINMGTGTIVIGLAAIVIGEVLGQLMPHKLRSFSSRLIAAVLGTVIYFLIRALVLQMGLDANDMKLLSAAIVAVALAIPYLGKQAKIRRAWKPGE